MLLAKRLFREQKNIIFLETDVENLAGVLTICTKYPEFRLEIKRISKCSKVYREFSDTSRRTPLFQLERHFSRFQSSINESSAAMQMKRPLFRVAVS